MKHKSRVTINYVVAEGTGTVNPGSESVKILNGVANGSKATAGKGYRFVGWYSDGACTNLLSQEPEFVPTKGTLLDPNNVESLGNKALLEKRINIRASDYRFDDKKKYYEGFTNTKGQAKEGTGIIELC